MAWRQPCDKPLSEPMLDSLLTHICVTRSQWIKPGIQIETDIKAHVNEQLIAQLASYWLAADPPTNQKACSITLIFIWIILENTDRGVENADNSNLYSRHEW